MHNVLFGQYDAKVSKNCTLCNGGPMVAIFTPSMNNTPTQGADTFNATAPAHNLIQILIQIQMLPTFLDFI